MRKKSRLYKSIFDLLLRSVQAKYEQLIFETGDKPKGKGAFYYGFGKKGEDEKYSLRRILREPNSFPELQNSFNNEHRNWTDSYQSELKNLSPKYLYNLHLQSYHSKDEFDIFEIDVIFLGLLCKFIGFSSINNFVSEYPGFNGKRRLLQQKLFQLDKGELSEEDLATKYIGLYWSYVAGTRRSLEVWINHYNKSGAKIPAKIVGLHSTDKEEFDGVNYSGMAEEIQSCISMTLKESIHGRPLSIIGYKGHLPLRNMENIFCVAAGISKFGYPVSIELILVKLTDKQKAIPSNELLNRIEGLPLLDFYLQMQRRNFRIPPRIVNDLSTIQARRQRPIEALHVRGTYRLWSIEYRGKINQIKFEIKEDFSVVFHTTANNNFTKQRGVFSFNTHFNKLCISAHNEYGIEVLAYYFLDFDLEGDNKIGKGIYCGIGTKRNEEISSGRLTGERIVYIREEEEFEAASLEPEEIASLVKESPKRLKAFELLMGENRINRRKDFINRIIDFRQAVHSHIL